MHSMAAQHGHNLRRSAEYIKMLSRKALQFARLYLKHPPRNLMKVPVAGKAWLYMGLPAFGLPILTSAIATMRIVD